MKTKPIIIIAFAALLMGSCIKDYMGHGGDKIKFTSDNYLYEGDLYSIYLNDKIEILDIKIQELNDIIANNQGDENTAKDLSAANEQRLILTEDLQGIISLEQVGLRLPPPPPPCPRPRNCDFSGLEYVLTSIVTEKINILFLDDNGDTVGGGTIDDLGILPDSGGQIKYSNLMMSGENFSVSAIQVTVFNDAGKAIRDYLIQ